MANRVEGFDERIIEYAEKEFLEKGFEAASLRVIAQHAGVSTSAIYTRYGDKEGLYRYLIQPAADGCQAILKQALGYFSSMSREEQAEQYKEYSDQGFEGLLNYIYDHFDAFKLLITCNHGTIYQDFLEELVRIDNVCTKEYLKRLDSSAYREGRITDGFLHVVASSFYSGLFEVVIHDMTLDDARKYIHELRNFFNHGWSAYLKKE